MEGKKVSEGRHHLLQPVSKIVHFREHDLVSYSFESPFPSLALYAPRSTHLSPLVIMLLIWIHTRVLHDSLSP